MAHCQSGASSGAARSTGASDLGCGVRTPRFGSETCRRRGAPESDGCGASLGAAGARRVRRPRAPAGAGRGGEAAEGCSGMSARRASTRFVEATATSRALGRRAADEGRGRIVADDDPWDLGAPLEKAARDLELGGRVSRRHQAVVADLDEAVRQHVLQEAADEFIGREGLGGVAAGAELDAVLRVAEQTLVGETHSMRIAAEVAEDVLGAGEEFLAAQPKASRRHLVAMSTTRAIPTCQLDYRAGRRPAASSPLGAAAGARARLGRHGDALRPGGGAGRREPAGVSRGLAEARGPLGANSLRKASSGQTRTAALRRQRARRALERDAGLLENPRDLRRGQVQSA